MKTNLHEIKDRILAKTLEKVIGEHSHKKIIQINSEILNAYQKELGKIEKLFHNIEKDINFREEGKTPLYTAIKEGYGELANYLINNGADANNINEENQTALDAIEAWCKASLGDPAFPEVDWNGPEMDTIGENPDYPITTDY
ncbi:hypothetical protein phytr_9600 [Candidatus Phycorickettsia trachydisci]|uniref:Uncharacterized protein n=1 Tax=Candidatus Phycorickettsia trachydisci TaxID=2115978 RepID=A0A2P1P9E0_9RICK|nr:ankyrin repeat domain-containing protein [Candidatus Phycorickettsia trachydisci]AVP87888.1 hypothetical protein phytr_9600 [Candidatus Phycorickettsia trachydisci]